MTNEKDTCSTEMITCTQCKKTLQASEFSKSQIKKFENRKASGRKVFFCVQCSKKTSGGKTTKKGSSPASSALVVKVCRHPTVDCIIYQYKQHLLIHRLKRQPHPRRRSKRQPLPITSDASRLKLCATKLYYNCNLIMKGSKTINIRVGHLAICRTKQ